VLACFPSHRCEQKSGAIAVSKDALFSPFYNGITEDEALARMLEIQI
jgi:hypothetical protein